MARYTADFLLYLRDSPLCVKPPSLPPAEEWMGPPPEVTRNQTKLATERTKPGDALLLNQENRRPALDRTISRTAANPDEIILGPPRTSFASATSMRNSRVGDADKGLKDSERQDRTDRFSFRARDPESTNDRFSRDTRGGRSTFGRRGDQDQDSEGWSTVKPRKSFGHEGAERFHGRMGGETRFTPRDDRRPTRDREDREPADRRSRNVDHAKEKDPEEVETPRRNGLTRGKTEPWFKETTSNASTTDSPISQRERIDRAKSWRERDQDDKPSDRHADRATDRHNDRANDRNTDRANDRNYDRRWDRADHRAERDPEWFDESGGEKAQAHTEEDFKKFMESMKASKGAPSKSDEKTPNLLDNRAPEAFVELEPKVVSAPAIESGPDKFFAAYTPSSENKEASKPKGGKSSRFMAFLAPQDESRVKTEPPTPAAAPTSNGPSNDGAPKNESEKEAFAMLIQKLQRSGVGPGMQASGPPPQSLAKLFEPMFSPDVQQKSAVTSPEPFQQYGGDRREDPRLRGHQHQLHEMPSARPPPVQPPPITRPEQALQDLLAQRHQIPNHQANNRTPQNPVAMNSNTEFLMRLMQSHRDAPEPPRTEQLLVRMPQPIKQVSIPNLPDREHDYQQNRRASQQQQQMRGQGPPGFLDEQQYHPSEVDSRPQPTQILQRPPPPGLDHHMHPFQMGGGGAQLAPQQRPMIPPPGLVNGPPRNVPLPGMYPPNFPPTAFPPPDPMVGGPRSMQPPPGFYAGPPPGFMPPPGMGAFQGPDGPPFGAPPPFDRRGMLPPGAYRGP
ncbi:hypothetical protein B0T22DRAFT_156781 [Podospora appendiculata]|uniref:Uncharacterized protein n=1 Tax=Podospora appendiculata TaxID=314037 RepID=A0AAE0XA23_9PEZI|nr:hypothetical protein B0T22DRAFT_156781 [Podospora appendiculata]